MLTSSTSEVGGRPKVWRSAPDDGGCQQGDAAGFIRLNGVPRHVRALKDRELTAKVEKAGAADTSLAYA